MSIRTAIAWLRAAAQADVLPAENSEPRPQRNASSVLPNAERLKHWPQAAVYQA